MIRTLFSLTLFLSATLVFWVQPMIGKMVLPYLGGTPAVWNTCLVFFQAALLLGYLYAHGLSRIASFKRRALIHLGLLVSFLCFLPVRLPADWKPPTDANPVPWLLWLLTVTIGPTFVLLSASAPLLQNWFVRGDDPQAKDPYFLYVASNVGSLVGLLGYPMLIEPHQTLLHQSWVWSAAYVLVMLSVAGCAYVVRARPDDAGPTDSISREALTTGRRLHWFGLAAVPSSLLQSVTTYLTTDIAAVPFLWVIPLSVYLISFIVVFSRRPIIPHKLAVRPILVVLLGYVIVTYWQMEMAFWMLLPLNLLVLFSSAMVCHGELVRLRPEVGSLTEFYLWMSTGGVVGGLFAAIVAPLVFNNVYEHPIAVLLVAMFVPVAADSEDGWSRPHMDVVWALVLGIVLYWGVMAPQLYFGGVLQDKYRVDVAVVAALVVYSFRSRPLRFALGLGALLVGGWFTAEPHSDVIYAKRNFYGILRVRSTENQTILAHGTTNHGGQMKDPSLRREPTWYFYRAGPLGDVFECMTRSRENLKIAVAGLGAGTISAYGRAGDEIVFYEINPDVTRIAAEAGYFTYLSESQAKVQVVHGDARLALMSAPARSFDLFILDAFTSDAVPVHLLTREALQLYRSKLASGGLIVFHISSRYPELEPVIEHLAADAHMKGYFCHERRVSEGRSPPMGKPSIWAVLADSAKELSCITDRRRWETLEAGGHHHHPWTDDYSDLFRYLKVWH